MGKKKVFVPLVSERHDLADHIPEFEDFKQQFEVIIYHYESKEKFIDDLQNTYNDFDAIYGTTSLLFIDFNDFIDYFPPNLKVIAYTWVGSNMFDVERLTEKGIILANIGDLSADEVADTALWLTLDIFKFNSYMQRALRAENDIRKIRSDNLGSSSFDKETGEVCTKTEREPLNFAKNLKIGGKMLQAPRGKVAGIVGFGGIGKAIARRLNVIGMKIKYTKRSEPLVPNDGLPFEAEYVKSLTELIPQVDLLVLAVPHTPQTINLINKDSIKLFKKGARIVNIGRGTVLDEDVVIDALEDGNLCSVGMDVFRNEPVVNERLTKRWDVSMTPHHAAFTVENFINANIKVMENITNVLLDGGRSLHPVN